MKNEEDLNENVLFFNYSLRSSASQSSILQKTLRHKNIYFYVVTNAITEKSHHIYFYI